MGRHTGVLHHAIYCPGGTWVSWCKETWETQVGSSLVGPHKSQMSSSKGLLRGSPSFLSAEMETGGRCCQRAPAESTAFLASMWPKSPMGEFPLQALLWGTFLLSLPTSVVLDVQYCAEQSWGQGRIRPRLCPQQQTGLQDLGAQRRWFAGNVVVLVENTKGDLQEMEQPE